MACDHTIIRSRVAIIEKNGIFGLLTLDITRKANLLGRLDPRLAEPINHKAFETPAEADHWFNEYVIATVSENGWSVVFNGERNNARLS